MYLFFKKTEIKTKSNNQWQNTAKSGTIQRKGAKYSKKWQNTAKSGKIQRKVAKYSEKWQNTAKKWRKTVN